MSKKQQAEHRAPVMRYRLVLVLWALLALVLVGRAVELHVFQHDFLARQGDLRNLRIEPIAAHRGLITDRHGRPLAVSTPVVTLWANPGEALEHDQTWLRLDGHPVLSSTELATRVRANASREFIYLKRHLAPESARAVLDKNIPGIYGLTEYRRYYPAGEVTSHLVGFTDIDENGQEGVELAFNDWLAGRLGKKKVVKDRLGRVVQDIEVLEDAEPGKEVRLSLDLRMQYIAYRELLAAIKQHKASSGSVVVLDAKTGEVLAMVNQPAYNPNNRARLSASALRNRAVTDVFEPGSTMKPLTVAAAMHFGLVSETTPIDTRPGYVKVGQKTIRDHRNYGVIDLATLLSKSSNVGATRLALELGETRLPVFLERFGLGQATGVRFPGESAGVLPFKRNWHDIELATLSYGYGVSVTALQLAQAYAILANGGIKMPLTLQYQSAAEPSLGEPVLQPAVVKAIVAMLETVVGEGGTAGKAGVAGYRVAGKTGTVHKITSQGYADDRYMSLFAGMAPASNPRVVAVVVIDDPRGDDYFGGQVAAPVFGKVMAGVLRLMKLEPDAATSVFANSLEPAPAVMPLTEREANI